MTTHGNLSYKSVSKLHPRSLIYDFKPMRYYITCNLIRLQLFQKKIIYIDESGFNRRLKKDKTWTKKGQNKIIKSI